MRNRRGISLIEVLVSVVLLGTIATVHTVVTMRYALRNRVAAAGVDRTAAMSTAVDLFATMPYASLGANTGCATLAIPARYPHQRCVTITNVSGFVTRVRIIIQPANTAFRPDTAFVDRSVPAGSGPFL